MPTKTLTRFGRWIVATLNRWTNRVVRALIRQPARFRRKAPGYPAFFYVLFTSALGASTPMRMIIGSIVYLTVAFVVSWVSFGAAFPLVLLFGTTLIIGFLRMLGPVDRQFVQIRGTLTP